MRNAFADELTKLGDQDSRVVMLSGDIGNRLFDKFKAKHPARFFNCGVAEANMMGVAAGLAMSGLRPICYTITPFITYRCMEQIRVDVCYHNVPVTIVGTGSGLSYASLGGTHHSCEEMGMLRLLPHLTVVAPADSREVRGALRAALSQSGPVYMRIGKKGEPDVHAEDVDFQLGKAIAMRDGADVCFLSTGTMLPEAMKSAEQLAAGGVSAAVFSFHTVKPLDTATLSGVFAKFTIVATLEEHSVLGGLGGSVAEWLADQPATQGRLVRFGTPDEFLHVTCEQEEARELYHLTADSLTHRIKLALG